MSTSQAKWRSYVVPQKTCLPWHGAGNGQRVHQLLYYEWTQRRLQRDAIAQSSLLGACARSAAWVSSLAALVDLEDVCDVVARGSAINACAKAKHWTHAVHLLRLKPWKRQMDTKKTNIICFNAALTGCQWYHTFQLVHLLRSEGLQADVISFNSVVAACGTKETSPTLKSTYWSRGLEALTSLFLQHLQATVVTMNSATNMCQKSGQWTVALSMSSKLQQSKLAVDSTSFTSVLTAIDHWSQCLECLEQHKVAVLATKGQRNTDEKKSHLGQMGTYNTIILNSALSSLATAWRHTLQLTQQTLFGEFGCSADTITLNTAASALCECNPLGACFDAIELQTRCLSAFLYSPTRRFYLQHRVERLWKGSTMGTCSAVVVGDGWNIPETRHHFFQCSSGCLWSSLGDGFGLGTSNGKL